MSISMAGQWLGEQEPWARSHSRAEDLQLLGGLDALGDTLSPSACARLITAETLFALRVDTERLDEQPIHLQDVQREPLEVAERRVTGAEVIDGQ